MQLEMKVRMSKDEVILHNKLASAGLVVSLSMMMMMITHLDFDTTIVDGMLILLLILILMMPIVDANADINSRMAGDIMKRALSS